MRKVKSFSVMAACILAASPLFTAALCAQEGGSGGAVRTGSSGYAMVRVPGGSFQMGNPDSSVPYSDDERPVRTVTLSAFSIGKHEVTQGLYETVMGYNPSYFGGDKSLPVEWVTWYDAVEFANKLSEKERLQPVYTISERVPAEGYIQSANITADWSKNGYRLPTEAQWEYAARGGNGSPGNYIYAGSNDADAVAWYDSNSGGSTRVRVVGTKAANSLGIHDMSGNVWEWCWDWYGTYPSEAQTDPSGASSGYYRVLRGGSWGNSSENVRSVGRSGSYADIRDGTYGFRLVRP